MTFFRNNAKYFFLFCLYMIWFSFIYPLNINIDEIWSYGFSLNLFNCEIPYLDFNMIVTPLYPLISSLPFYIFGKNIINLHFSSVKLNIIAEYLVPTIRFRSFRHNRRVAPQHILLLQNVDYRL